VPLLQEVLAKYKEKWGPNHPNTLTIMNNLGAAYRVSGQLDKAVSQLELTLNKR